MKKFLITTSILLLAAACNKQQAQVQPVQSQPAQISQSRQQQTKPADETADWKVYASSDSQLDWIKNTSHPFTFRYPASWYLQETKGGVELQNFENGETYLGQGLLQNGQFRMEIYPDWQQVDKKQDLASWCKYRLDPKLFTADFQNETSFKVGNLDAFKVDYQIKEDSRLNGRRICIKNAESTKFVVTGYPLNFSDVGMVDKLVSTLKFNK